jgi:TetR/AcrR family transcriptional regulator
MNNNKLDTVSRIMQAAITHFSRKGFGGARIDEIAKEAGVNKAAIYYHIGDKGALYEKVVEQVLGGMADRLTDNIKEAQTDSERIRVFIVTLARNISENEHIAPLILREIAEGGAALPDKVMLQMVRIFGALFCILDEASAQGRYREVNPLIIHLLILGGLAAFTAGQGMRESIASLGGEDIQLDPDVSEEEAGRHIADLIAQALKK